MAANVREMTAVVHKLFGKTHEEAAKQLYPGANLARKEIQQSYPWGVHVTDDHLGGSMVTVGFMNYTNVLQFTISPYPSCCGSRMFHTFRVDEAKVTQEQLDEVMNAFVRENRGGALGNCNRIEVVMVETRTDRNGSHVHRTAMEDPQPVEDPKIRYKTLWNFFHKNAKRVRTRLEVNDNTCNVLHNMEVIL